MILPAGGQRRRRPVLAGSRGVQFAHAFALGFLGVPDAPALVSELEPGKFRWVYRLEVRPLELAVRGGARLAIGWPRRGLWQGRVGLLLSALLRAAGQDRGDGRSEQDGCLSSRMAQARS